MEVGDETSDVYLQTLRDAGVQFETKECDGSFENSYTLTTDSTTLKTIRWNTDCSGLADPNLAFVVVNGSTIPSDTIVRRFYPCWIVMLAGFAS